MSDGLLMDLNKLDKDKLLTKMTEDLPLITGAMETYPSEIAHRSGLDRNRMSLIVSGKRKMKWSEYMSILFVLWDDAVGRKMVEEKGLFPGELRNIMAINRGNHEED